MSKKSRAKCKAKRKKLHSRNGSKYQQSMGTSGKTFVSPGRSGKGRKTGGGK